MELLVCYHVELIQQVFFIKNVFHMKDFSANHVFYVPIESCMIYTIYEMV